MPTPYPQRADAIMLSGETAAGNYPVKAMKIMDQVSRKIEANFVGVKNIEGTATHDPREEIARNAAILSNNLQASALIAFTRSGYTATLLSRCRANSPIFAFTNTPLVRRRLNLYWGITSFRIEFSKDPEKSIQRALTVLSRRKLLSSKDRIVVVSDILVGQEFVETIQVRDVK